MKITEREIKDFAMQLRADGKTPATIEKYRREAARFAAWLDGQALEKAAAQSYKEGLARTCAPAGINGAVAALSCLFDFLGVAECRLKAVRIQRQIFRDETRELTEQEYRRLLTRRRRERMSGCYW